MMSAPVNTKKRSNSMNYVLPEGDLELFPTLIQWIDSCNGFIYGSVMMRYIAKIVNSVPRDIDIAFINRKDFDKFIGSSVGIMDTICKKFRSDKCFAEHYHGQP